MFQSEALQTNFRRLMNFFAYTRNYFVRNNPIKAKATYFNEKRLPRG